MRILKRKRSKMHVHPLFPVGSIIGCSRGNCYYQDKDGSLKKIVTFSKQQDCLTLGLKNGSIITVVGKTC